MNGTVIPVRLAAGLPQKTGGGPVGVGIGGDLRSLGRGRGLDGDLLIRSLVRLSGVRKDILSARFAVPLSRWVTAQTRYSSSESSSTPAILAATSSEGTFDPFSINET
jgi:hypothetical protein